MIHIGLTGNMGSGKSIVCRLLKTMFGIPIFDADAEAKLVMVQDQHLKAGIIAAFGQESYLPDGSVNRPWLSQQVFHDKEKLAVLNGLVHPASLHRYAEWQVRQQAPYTIKEAALLYEATDWQALAATVVVTCPAEQRLKRVLLRDPYRDREQVLNIFNNQWPEAKKVSLATYLVVNDEIEALLPQVNRLHEALLSLASASKG